MSRAASLQMRLLPAGVFALVVGLAARPAHAGGGALFGGWEGDGLSQGYGYAAAGQRWPASPLGLSGRLQASYLYYRFSDAGGLTRVWSPGATLLLGPSASGAHGSTALLVGLDLRRERRERPAGTTRETQTGLQLQWEASPSLGPRARSFALAQYSFANEYTYARASLGRQISNFSWTGPTTTVLGIEAAGQGNRESDAWQVGGYGECALARIGLSLSIHGGYKDSGSPGAAREHSYFVGAGLYLSR